MSRFDLFYVLIDECSEVSEENYHFFFFFCIFISVRYLQVVDYAIAKKIVEIHSNMEDTIETLYSQEDILSYISFARQFKPQISIVSKMQYIVT